MDIGQIMRKTMIIIITSQRLHVTFHMSFVLYGFQFATLSV